MKIITAKENQLEIVEHITITTIRNIYPRYYPSGAVDFFINHHRSENILSDIKNGYVFLLVSDSDSFAGTVTVKNNEINRLFVLPDFQGKGYGGTLLDYAEKLVFESYDNIVISSSLPAKPIYLRRNYTETSFNKIVTANGDYLCYDEMKKYKK